MTFNLEKQCAKKIKVMRNIVFTEEEVKCRNCTNPQYCERFISYRPSRIEMLYDIESRRQS